MTTILITMVVVFYLGTLMGKVEVKKIAKKQGCPFRHACMEYDSSEIKDAVKKVLTLMISEASNEDIQIHIDRSIKPNHPDRGKFMANRYQSAHIE
jgi:hypothetical protein